MIRVDDEVRGALEGGGPVVVLESSVLAQGLPYPENLQSCRRTRAAVRASGAVPATAAVIRGELRVGLAEEELEALADGAYSKLSVRDLPIAMAKGDDGALTVSATAAAAALAGARVMATGGIGGVHHGWQESLDISSDLQELARAPVAVVSSGIKSVLDIPLTLEVLETLAVPVIGYRTQRVPGFYIRDTGHTLEHSVDGPEAAARAMGSQWSTLGRDSGLLFFSPVAEADSLEAAQVADAVARAVEQAAVAGVTGKAVTPFLLRRIENLTGGRSLEANMSLLEDNARVASAIAVADCEMRAK